MGLDMTKCNGYCGKCLKWSVHYGIRDCGEDDGINESLALKTCEDEKKKIPLNSQHCFKYMSAWMNGLINGLQIDYVSK